MANSIEGPTILNNDNEHLPHDIDQPVDWKKIYNIGPLHNNRGCFDRFANAKVSFKKRKRFR